ncbi:MAG: hypothetical protein GX639_07795, partial [Fibrobacter sp.]|nr:hypothetical protein [Fibrobacter sp.]
MAELSIQFTDPDSEMFLNEDISGNKAVSTPQSESSDHPLPDNFWLRNYNNFSLVQNNDQAGKVIDKFGEEVNNNEHKTVFNKVYIMAMRGSNAFELERTIKLSFSNQDFHSNLFLQNSLFILPMIGPV